jgi:hypothetical protein|tara:strand:+ start:42 stop:209 length:168 start_codon:yes stop_codon:yes gene_type:complete
MSLRKDILIEIDDLLMKKIYKNNRDYDCGFILNNEWQVYNKEITKVLNDTRTLLK